MSDARPTGADRGLAWPTALGRSGPEYPQVTAPTYLDALAYRLGGRAGLGCLPDRVGQRLKVIGGRLLARSQRQPDDVPAARCGQPVGMRAAQVVAVRFDIGGQRP